MSNFTAPHDMETFDDHPEGELANDAFFERLEAMIRGGGGKPDWMSTDLAITLYRNVREDEGWHKHRTITTIEELRELPYEAVIRDREGVVYETDGGGGWFAAINAGWDGNFYRTSQIELPVTVLFVPEVKA